MRRGIAGRRNESRAVATVIALVVALGGSLSARAAPGARPTRAQLPSPHIAWRLDGVDLGGFILYTRPVAGGVAAFGVDDATGDVLALDVATGKPRWRTPAPKDAALPRGPARPTDVEASIMARVMGPGRGPGMSVSLTLEKDALSVRWSDKLESRVSLADGRILSSSPAKQRSYDRSEIPPRWRVTKGAINEVGGAHRTFPLPAFVEPAPDLGILESKDRLLVVQSEGRVDGEAVLVTWTTRAPKPVVIRRPAVATTFALEGDLLVASCSYDRVLMGIDLTRLDPALGALSAAGAIAAARAERGPDQRLLDQELVPLPNLADLWIEVLGRPKDPLFTMALDALAQRPDLRALPALLALVPPPESPESMLNAHVGYSLVQALAAQDDVRVPARLAELERVARGPYRSDLYRDAARTQLWRTGRTVSAGLCKPHPERALAALAKTAPDQTIGTAHPFVFEDVARDGGWTAICQARADTNKDGKIEIHFGHHGEPFGDEIRPYLVVGSGPGAGFDEILASDDTGRWVAARDGACLSLVDTRKKTEVVMGDADLRDDDGVFGPHRAASFDARGEHLLYLRGSPKGDRLVVRTLATGAEAEIDPGPGVLWRAQLDPDGQWVMADMITDREFPRIVTTFAGRVCRGPAASYSMFGMSSRPTVTRRWVGIGGGSLSMKAPVGLIRPYGNGVLVRRDDDAIVFVDGGGKETPLVPTTCHGSVVGADARGRALAVVCEGMANSDSYEERRGTLTIYGGGAPIALGPAHFPISDISRRVTADVVEWDGKYIDLAARKKVPEPAGSQGIATRSWEERERGILARRADGATLRAVTKADPKSEERFSRAPSGPLRWEPPQPAR